MSTRREFLRLASAGLMAPTWASVVATQGADAAPRAAGDLHIAPFKFDVTPPLGHPCCGGWIKPIVGYDDPMEGLGFVLLGAGQPMVVCAVDWTSILNQGHLNWRIALAEAAGTTPDRVALQCVHQHNAPLACVEAERLLQAANSPTSLTNIGFFELCMERAHYAVRRSLPQARRVTHVAHGQGKVEKVASNRRIHDSQGKLIDRRGSASSNPRHWEIPDGQIDPWLKTVAFYDGDTRLVACHYYATHPMSYYGDGRASSDFVGLARKRRQREDPDCLHIYFTGCAGDVAAGKYNDGSRERRGVLADRIHAGMLAADQSLKRQPVNSVRWRGAELVPAPRDTLKLEALQQQIADRSATTVARNRPAYMLAWLLRLERGQPLPLSALEINHLSLLHLPAESFIAYQLRAQQAAGKRFVATAAYGDGGPWYIPTAPDYPNGGYEVSVAFADPQIDGLLTQAIESLVTG